MQVILGPKGLNRPFTRTNSYFYSFVPQTIFHWNKLDIVCASSVHAFNRYLHVHSTSLGLVYGSCLVLANVAISLSLMTKLL